MKRTMKMVAGLAFLAASVGSGMADDYVPNWETGIWGTNSNEKISGYSGNLLLMGPGQHQVEVVPSTAFPDAYRWDTNDQYSATQNLGQVYKFTFVGIEGHADADGVPGWYSWGGYMQTYSEQDAIDRGDGVLSCTEAGGWWFKGGVNGDWADGIWFQSAKVGYRGEPQQSLLNHAKVYENENITLEWYISTNARGIDGYMKILGTVQRSATEVTGQLFTEFDTYVEKSVPVIAWDIDRTGTGRSDNEN